MKPPLCRVCNERHHLREPHVFPDVPVPVETPRPPAVTNASPNRVSPNIRHLTAIVKRHLHALCPQRPLASEAPRRLSTPTCAI